MAYISKIIAKDEQLIGLARLHWIYVFQGLLWFALFMGAGVLSKSIFYHMALWLSVKTSHAAAPLFLDNLSSMSFYILSFAGAYLFLMMSLTMVTTELALTSRRVILKRGLIFVNVKQVDLEEIRGESLAKGLLGHVFGYGWLTLDCRFIGDMRTPVISNPESFLRALHEARGNTQDAISIVMGKGSATPAKVITHEENDQNLDIEDPKPLPAFTPDGDMVFDASADARGKAGSNVTQMAPANAQIAYKGVPNQMIMLSLPGTVAGDTLGVGFVPPIPHPAQQEQASSATVVVDEKVVAQVMEQSMPKMVQEVVKQMADQGLINNNDVTEEVHVDTALMASFDEACEQGGQHHKDVRNKMDQSFH